MTSKAVVFAYHDIGCTGIEALLNAGYEIAAVFTHADDPRKTPSTPRSRASAPSAAFRCTRPRT